MKNKNRKILFKIIEGMGMYER